MPSARTLRSAFAKPDQVRRSSGSAYNPYAVPDEEENPQDTWPPEPHFGGPHALTLNVLLADGSVRGLSKNIDQGLFSRLGSRNDGSLISDFDF